MKNGKHVDAYMACCRKKSVITIEQYISFCEILEQVKKEETDKFVLEKIK